MYNTGVSTGWVISILSGLCPSLFGNVPTSMLPCLLDFKTGLNFQTAPDHPEREDHWFPAAALTHGHKLSDLKQHTSIILHFERSEVCKGAHWAKTSVLDRMVFPAESGGGLFFPFPVSRSCPYH